MRMILDRLLVRAQVTSVTRLTPRLRGIGLAGRDLAGLDWTPGQHVRVFFSPPAHLLEAVRADSRDYSVWSYDPSGSCELRIYLHGEDGPGERWARGVRPGDEVALTRPEGHLTAVPGAAFHLVVGDDPGAVALGAIVRGLPPSAPLHGVIELADAQERSDYPRAGELDWHYRDGAAAAASGRLAEAVRGLTLPDGEGVAYVAAEARTCRLVRDHLIRERGWRREAVRTKAFWTAGRRGG